MLNSLPTFTSWSPANQHAMDEEHRESCDPQGKFFETSNSIRYLSDHLLSFLPPVFNDQLDRQSNEELVGTLTTHFPILTRQTDTTALSHVGLESDTSTETKTTWLEEALRELAACPTYAVDEDLEIPSTLGLMKAEQVLKEISISVRDQPDIYMMDEGNIAIDFRNSKSQSGVFFLIEKDGSGALFHRTQKSKGRLRVDDAADLPSEGGLQELKRVGIQ